MPSTMRTSRRFSRPVSCREEVGRAGVRSPAADASRLGPCALGVDSQQGALKPSPTREVTSSPVTEQARSSMADVAQREFLSDDKPPRSKSHYQNEILSGEATAALSHVRGYPGRATSQVDAAFRGRRRRGPLHPPQPLRGGPRPPRHREEIETSGSPGYDFVLIVLAWPRNRTGGGRAVTKTEAPAVIEPRLASCVGRAPRPAVRFASTTVPRATPSWLSQFLWSNRTVTHSTSRLHDGCPDHRLDRASFPSTGPDYLPFDWLQQSGPVHHAHLLGFGLSAGEVGLRRGSLGRYPESASSIDGH